MTYTPQTWNNGAAGGTPISAARLGVMEAGIAAAATATLGTSAQTGTSYTLVLADANKFITLSNASAIALTVPTNASVAFPIGTRIHLAAIGAGTVTVSGAGGVTVNSRGSVFASAGQYAVFSLVKTGTNTWLLSGDLA